MATKNLGRSPKSQSAQASTYSPTGCAEHVDKLQQDCARYREQLLERERVINDLLDERDGLRAERDVAAKKLVALEEALTPAVPGVSFKGTRFPDEDEPDGLEKEEQRTQVAFRQGPQGRPCSGCGSQGTPEIRVGGRTGVSVRRNGPPRPRL